MTTPFGPQLVGETEKTLNALLRRVLGGRLTEPQWVTLRLAQLLQTDVDGGEELAARVAERARFDDASAVVAALTAAGLVAEGRPTAAGDVLVAEVQAGIAAETGPIWRDLDEGDVAATTRILNEVVARARALLV